MSDLISSRDVAEQIRSMQKDYSAADLLNPDAARGARYERDLLSRQIRSILDTLTPFLPGEVRYEAHLVDEVDVAETRGVRDGRQLILVGRHFIAFLRNLIDVLLSGIPIDEDGAVRVPLGVPNKRLDLFGKNLGEYLELGAPLTFSDQARDRLGPEVLVSAIEFVLGHEIVHRIEAHATDDDLSLTGFQDFCRRRGQEYLCDRKSVGLLLLRRKNALYPELAFMGAVTALLALSWLEQFTPGWTPHADGYLHYPGSDSRVMRVHLEEQLYWRAAGLKGIPRDISGAILRMAFQFLSGLEQQPKLIASPLNAMVQNCLKNGEPDHEQFQLRAGILFASGRTTRVASALGAIWGSSEVMSAEEESDPSLTPQGRPAVEMFEGLHRRLADAGTLCGMVADEMAAARARQREMAS